MSSPAGQPNSRFAHVYVVVRLPRRTEPVSDLDRAAANVVTTKAFWSADEAEDEVRRLTQLNGGHWLYFVRVARLAERVAGKDVRDR